jgi:uncharacterized delta-60 repeat protein
MRNHIARLNSDGSVDASFDPNASSTVNTLALQRDGKIIVGGNFTSLAPNGGSSVTRNHVARLNSDGSLDMGFDPNPNDAVYALALQPDGEITMAGGFTTLPSGTHNFIARVFENGSADLTFYAGADSPVNALATQVDGKLVLGGSFDNVKSSFGAANVPRKGLARIRIPQAALQSLRVVGYSTGGSVVTWERSGAGPELAAAPQLESSPDGVTYDPVGTMQQFSGGWRYTGFVPPLGEYFYLRSQGAVTSGQYNGSGGLVESTLHAYLDGNDGIFTNDFQ